MHSYFSNKTQPFAKADYATFVAEIASTVNEKEILGNKGKISKRLADEKAGGEYDVFNKRRLGDYVSDFDLECRRVLDER